jgi:hypothetical protein
MKFNKANTAKLYEELATSKKILEDLSGIQVLGHRAPVLSIRNDDTWAFELIQKAGFKYDSSLLSNKFDSEIYQTPEGLIRVTVNGFRCSRFYFPVFGGGYYRILPNSVLDIILKKIKLNQVNLYLHPYEFDNDLNSLPSEYRIFCNELGKIDKLKLKLSRFRRSSIEVKLNKMVNSSDLNFLTISSKLESLKLI